MTNLYKVRNLTEAAWDEITDNDEYELEEDVIDIVWCKGVVRLDIMANGARIVPILRKVEKTLLAAGLAGRHEVFEGWFGAWADSLTDRVEKKYFVWSYDGKNDRENGHWSYSWGIEQLDEGTWYIFLNLAI